MKLTKYEHACFTIEENNKLLVVDPGCYSTDLNTSSNIAVIVVTHIHPDHFDENILSKIAKANPNVVLYAPKAVIDSLSFNVASHAVAEGDMITADPFKLEFFGKTHAPMHPELPVVDNAGVLINNLVYYPGDSFTLPNKAVKVLALPVDAGWMKISEAVEFLRAVKPELAFPTHDIQLSDVGKPNVDNKFPRFCEQISCTYQRLEKPLEIPS